jgi:hydroxyethylthiazole kinase
MTIQTEQLAQTLHRVRQTHPVVHALTNWVTAGDVANALHAIGARPIMASALEEVEEIVSRADVFVINVGTPDPLRIKAMLSAGYCANRLGRPVILDPVGVGASRFRMDSVQTILSALRIAVIRGNRAEIGALAGTGGQLRGIDSVQEPPDIHAAAKTLSQKTGAVIAVSGAQDLVVKGEMIVSVENGHPMMGQVTGMGCMLTAVIAAFAVVEPDPMVAAVAAMAFFGLAGELAVQQAKGPGSFRINLLDALYAMTPEELKAGAKLKD